MTVEERMQSIETTVRDQGNRLERHSQRLEKLERNNEAIQDIQLKVSNMEGEMKKMKAHQTITDNKLLKKSNWTIALLCTIVGLIIYIAFKSPETAKDVVGIASKAVVQGVTTL